MFETDIMKIIIYTSHVKIFKNQKIINLNKKDKTFLLPMLIACWELSKNILLLYWLNNHQKTKKIILLNIFLNNEAGEIFNK